MDGASEQAPGVHVKSFKIRVLLFLELQEAEWGIFGLSLLIVGCFMWIACG
ncbi:hypothetical protein HpHN84_05300 [Helicobacter pylori]